jgi:DNA-binding transcriptional MerR regulator
MAADSPGLPRAGSAEHVGPLTQFVADRADGLGGLTVAAVARRIGVAPATLRTWDRRYGLGPSEHRAGAHRRYAPADIARLTVMRRLVLEGVPPGEAARIALDAPPAGPPRGGGGRRAVALPDAEPVARGLARAALAHDSAECSRIVSGALRRGGVVETWDSVVTPVLTAIGRRWESTGAGVDVEHLLSEAVLGALRAYSARQPVAASPRPVLLACAEDEQHALAVHALAAALAERQVAARLLGARVPREALAEAVRRVGPAALFVWSSLDVTGRPEQLAALPVLRPPVPLVVGGPGWQVDRLPPAAHLVTTLAEAVDTLVATAGG